MLSAESLDLLFIRAHTHSAGLNKPVDEVLLVKLWDAATRSKPHAV